MASTSPGTNISVNRDVDISKTPRIAFLVLFIVISFVGNLFIVVVVFQNKKYRTVNNLLICNLCIICIADCVFNMSLVLGALIKDDWIYGQCMCQVNLFFMNFVAYSTILAVTSLSCDQFFSLTFSSKYDSWFSSYRFYLSVSYMWLQALTFSIPFLTDAVNSTFRPHLHLCTVTGNTSAAFLYSSLIVCFLLPLISAIVFQILLLRLSWIQNHKRKKEMAEKQYTQMLTDSPQIHIEHSAPSYILFTFLIFLSWLILHAPLALTSNIKQYHFSEESEESIFTEYPWEVDATFIWMRFFFSSLVPCFTFYYRKDIRQSTKECVLCRKHNSVIDMDVVSRDSDVIVKKLTILKSDNPPTTPKQKDKEKSETPVAFTVPVLFATSNGIRIGNTANDNEMDSKAFSSSCSLKFQASDAFQGKFLDVHYGGQEKPEELVGDTSDYDSSCEIDPYSISQPISTRNVVSTLRRTLSMSNSEIPASIHKELTGTIGADSGLDLSGTAGSSSGNLIKAKMQLHENQMHVNKEHTTNIRMNTSLLDKSIHKNTSSSLNTVTETSLNTVTENDERHHEDKHEDKNIYQHTKHQSHRRLEPIPSVSKTCSPTKKSRRRGRINTNSVNAGNQPISSNDDDTGLNLRDVTASSHYKPRQEPSAQRDS